MSNAYVEILELLKKEKTRPADLVHENILLGSEIVPLLFTEMDEKEKQAYQEQKIHSEGPKQIIKTAKPWATNSEILWDIDDEHMTGFFNEAGKFIINVTWLIKNKGNVTGPYTTEEVFNMRNSIENSMLKRDKDPIFIPFSELQNVIFSTNDADPINNIFKAYSHTENLNAKEFLNKKKSHVDLETLVNRIKSVNKDDVIKTVNKLTGMSVKDCEKFLEIYKKESLKNKIVVDDDGFETVVNKPRIKK